MNVTQVDSVAWVINKHRVAWLRHSWIWDTVHVVRVVIDCVLWVTLRVLLSQFPVRDQLTVIVRVKSLCARKRLPDLFETSVASVHLYLLHGSSKTCICAQIILGSNVYQVLEQWVSDNRNILSGTSLSYALSISEVAFDNWQLHLIVQWRGSFNLSLADANIGPLVQ